MAIGFPAGITEQYIVNNAQSKLRALRQAIHDVQDLYSWASAYSAADLEAAPVSMDAASASALLSALADANAIGQVYLTGQAPGSYPQVGSPYVYATSQRAVIGPL